MSLINTLVSLVGVNTVLPAVERIAIEDVENLANKDKAEIAATIELPVELCQELIAKTGGNSTNMLAAREALGAAWANFVLSFLPGEPAPAEPAADTTDPAA